MTRVTDEDLALARVILNQYTTIDRSASLGDSILTELLALRKASDAARVLVDATQESTQWDIVDALESALGEAGR